MYVNTDTPSPFKILAEESKSKDLPESTSEHHDLSSKVSENIYEDVPNPAFFQRKCEDSPHTSTNVAIVGFLPESKTGPPIRLSQVESLYDIQETDPGSAYVNFPSSTTDNYHPGASKVIITESKHDDENDQGIYIFEDSHDDEVTNTNVRSSMGLSNQPMCSEIKNHSRNLAEGSKPKGHPESTPDQNTSSLRISETIYDDIPSHVFFQSKCEDSTHTSTNVAGFLPESKSGPSIQLSHVENIYDLPETDLGSKYVNLPSPTIDKHQLDELQRHTSEVAISESKLDDEYHQIIYPEASHSGEVSDASIPITSLNRVESMYVYNTSFANTIYENEDSVSTKPCGDDKQNLYTNLVSYENLPSQSRDDSHEAKCSGKQSLYQNTIFYENVSTERKGHVTIAEDVYDDVRGQEDNIYEFEKCQYPITVQQRPHNESTEPGFNFQPESRHEHSKSIKINSPGLIEPSHSPEHKQLAHGDKNSQSSCNTPTKKMEIIDRTSHIYEVEDYFQHDSSQNKECEEDLYIYQN